MSDYIENRISSLENRVGEIERHFNPLVARVNDLEDEITKLSEEVEFLESANQNTVNTFQRVWRAIYKLRETKTESHTDQSTEEFVRVVRCKDCAYWGEPYGGEPNDFGYRYCYELKKNTCKDGYCYKGEPK